MLNLLSLHQLARNGDGLNPTIHALLVRRAAIEGNPKVAILHPGIAFGSGKAGRGSEGRSGNEGRSIR